jgi:apolipoprotein N-acyltransferase
VVLIRWPVAVVAALGAGALLLLSFPRYGLWWLAPIAVALFALAVRGRRLRHAAGLGLLAGIVFFGPLLSWTNMHVGYTPWILLTLYQACYFALLGMALAWASPLARRWPASWPFIVGLLWVAQEALRDRAPFGGFPWGRLAFSQGDSPALTLAAVGGAPLVTFAVALAGGLLATGVAALLTRTSTASRETPRDATDETTRVPGAAEAGAASDADGKDETTQGPDAVGTPGLNAAEGGANQAGAGVSAAAAGRDPALTTAPPGTDQTGTDQTGTGKAGAEKIRAGGKPARDSGMGRAGGLAAVAGAVAVMAIGLAVPVAAPGGEPVTVAVVQGNVPRLGLDFNEQRKAVLDNHVRATLELAGRVDRGEVAQPDLVIWPENASDIDPLVNRDAAASIDQAARAIGAPILVGAVLTGPGPNESRNAGIVWMPSSGPGEMYLKRHPVPFAEYLPMRPIVEPIAKAITNKAKLLRTDFVSGTTPGVLDMGGTTVGDVICFEVAYDEVVRDVVTSGAQLLAVQTNNATFNESEAAQQLAMVRLRAVEHGRDALMASTVGISAFVGADGQVYDPTAFNTAAVIVRELHPSASTTLGTRLGVWPEAVLTLIAVAALVLAATTRRRVN